MQYNAVKIGHLMISGKQYAQRVNLLRFVQGHLPGFGAVYHRQDVRAFEFLGCSIRIFAIDVYCALVSGYMIPRTIKVMMIRRSPEAAHKAVDPLPSNLNSG